MKNHIFIIVLFLFLSGTTLAEEPADVPTKINQNYDNQSKKEEGHLERYIAETMSAATRRFHILDDETLEQIYQNSPKQLKDYVEILDKLINEKKLDKETCFLFPNRLLLVGQPGVGKSMLATIIARKLKLVSFFILMPLLSNEYRNSEIACLARLFEEAHRINKPCIIILDELNIFTDRKATLGGESDRALGAALWLLLDKYAYSQNIIVIGTANDVTKLPPQLKDRFEGNVIQIEEGDWLYRYEIIDYCLNKYGSSCTFDYVKNLAKKTKGFSPRQLESMVKIAYQKIFLWNAPLSCVSDTELEAAYQQCVKGSNLLESKRWFNMKEWIRENSLVIQTISSAANLALVCSGFLYAITGKLLKN